ncbi:MAG: monovalent cation/H(+) antiporter subunit G [Pseudomonadota bacterium]|nr:monovalent cation/H(+) antiporter subunit G [Pseudomonadota bacterium]
MNATWIDIVAAVPLFAGCLLTVIGAWGTLRLPDFYTRMHAASVTDTLATFLVLLGLAVIAASTGDWLIIVKLTMILGFLWFTSPMAAYAIGHAAYFSGPKPMLDHDLVNDPDRAA